MMKNYVAIDIGASSGRVILGRLIDNKINLEEIHRFKNGFRFVNHHDRWNIDELIREIFIGLEKAKALGVEECSIGIDTWGVDYVMVREDGTKIADPISYRDKRTLNKIDELTSVWSKETIYEKTGIQFLELNTLYQLYVEDEELLEKTNRLLFIPDYIGYVLTGNMVTEVTNASTTQMLNLREELFDADILKSLKIDSNKFSPLVDSGTKLGEIQEKWFDQYDLPNGEVVTVATHDTASAVLGAPAVTDDTWAFISSGTWSLIGIESAVPINTPKAFEHNFTNEWGAYGTYRFLKNIMGLWMVQEVARLGDYKYSYPEMAELAEEVPFFQSVVDVNDARFNNPENMIEVIQEFCKETDQVVPQTIGELTNCIYSSLVKSYISELKNIEDITGNKISQLYIVGGGSNVDLLNQLTANHAGISVFSGPSEATAIGNLLVQMISNGDITDIKEGREIIEASFNIKKFNPIQKMG